MCTPKDQQPQSGHERLVIDSALLDAATQRAQQTGRTLGELVDAALRLELARETADIGPPEMPLLPTPA